MKIKNNPVVIFAIGVLATLNGSVNASGNTIASAPSKECKEIRKAIKKLKDGSSGQDGSAHYWEQKGRSIGCDLSASEEDAEISDKEAQTDLTNSKECKSIDDVIKKLRDGEVRQDGTLEYWQHIAKKNNCDLSKQISGNQVSCSMSDDYNYVVCNGDTYRLDTSINSLGRGLEKSSDSHNNSRSRDTKSIDKQ